MNILLKLLVRVFLVAIGVCGLLLVKRAYGSIPIRDKNGCITETAMPSSTTIPWYLVKGETIVYRKIDLSGKCPEIIRIVTDLKLPITGRFVGQFVKVWLDSFITVPSENEVKFFPTRDVYILNIQKWSFKDLRNKGNKKP